MLFQYILIELTMIKIPLAVILLTFVVIWVNSSFLSLLFTLRRLLSAAKLPSKCHYEKSIINFIYTFHI